MRLRINAHLLPALVVVVLILLTIVMTWPVTAHWAGRSPEVMVTLMCILTAR